MRQRRLWLTVLVVVLSVCGACSRDKKAEQLAALDRGLEAGLLTKDEYQAKKAMVLGTAATGMATPAPASVPEPANGASLATPPSPATLPPSIGSSPVPNAPATPAIVTPAPDRSGKKPRALSDPEPAAPNPEAAATGTPRQRPAEIPPSRAVRQSSSGEDAEPAPLAGCQDAATKPGKEKGKVERFFPMPMAKVKDAALGALAALEFAVNKDSGRELEASKKRHIGVVGSGGERMVLRFEESAEGGQRGTLVVGETKKGFFLRAGQKSWTNAVLSQTGCMLRKGVSGHAGQARQHE